MEPILLINPNSSTATTELMVELARETAGATVQIRGETVASGPPMITTEEALDAAEAGVIDIGLRQAGVSPAERARRAVEGTRRFLAR